MIVFFRFVFLLATKLFLSFAADCHHFTTIMVFPRFKSDDQRWSGRLAGGSSLKILKDSTFCAKSTAMNILTPTFTFMLPSPYVAPSKEIAIIQNGKLVCDDPHEFQIDVCIFIL